MVSTKVTSGSYFTTLNFVYLGLLAGQVFFMVVAIFLNSTGAMVVEPEELNTFFQILVPLFTVTAIIASIMITRTRLSRIKEKTDFQEKLGDYRAVMIVRLAILEAPSFFAIVCYLLTANLLLLIFSGLVIAIFLLYRPSRDKVAEELELNQEERELIDNRDAIVASMNE